MQRKILLSILAASSTSPLHAQFGPAQLVTDEAEIVWDLAAADFDGDGDVDVVSGSATWSTASPGRIYWLENLGDNTFASAGVIESQAWYQPAAADAVDIDGDGDPDLLSLTDTVLSWYENLGGGAFSSIQVIEFLSAGDGTDAVAEDLDGDGDMDVVHVSWSGSTYWHENLGGGQFGPPLLVGADSNYSDSRVFTADLNGDGLPDVLRSADGWSVGPADDEIVWYENLGNGGFGPEQLITNAAYGVRCLFALDLDGDQDVDVLSASRDDDKVAWYENLGGGAFGPQQVLAADVDVAFGVTAVDLDGDGDPDVASVSFGKSELAWFENLGGGAFGPAQVISTSTNHTKSVVAADMDGDGDSDLLSGGADLIHWHENLSAVVQIHGCGINPPGSLTVQSGSATPGANLVFGIDNPSGTQAAGSISALALAFSPHPNFPCGTALPGTGMVAPFTGELLLDTSTLLLLGGPLWTGPGAPAPIPVHIPADPLLIGLEFFAQGLLLDVSPSAVAPIGLTEGARVKIGT